MDPLRSCEGLLQVALDVLRGGSPVGSAQGQSIPVYSSNADFTFQGKHGAPRLAGELLNP